MDEIDEDGHCLEFFVSLWYLDDWGMFSIDFKSPVDLRSYGDLCFSGKVVDVDYEGPNSVSFEMLIGDDVYREAKLISNECKQICVSLPPGLNNVSEPINVLFDEKHTGQHDFTIRLNNIRFEKTIAT